MLPSKYYIATTVDTTLQPTHYDFQNLVKFEVTYILIQSIYSIEYYNIYCHI